MEQTPPPNIIDDIRAVMPSSILSYLPRQLRRDEARDIAERQAATLLRLLDITKPPVEIELVMERPELVIEFVWQPLAGVTEWTGDHWKIHVNADYDVWQAREALAQKLKYILDDPFREALYPDWSHHDSAQRRPESTEAIAKYFAGCVLVPTPWLIQAREKGTHSVSGLATLFHVSEQLIRTRLCQADLAPNCWRGYTRCVCRKGRQAITEQVEHLAANRPALSGAQT
ncbi:ImmA/IrrE family metallo-endopeptidase [Fodinicola acaciae]|uniref:ImmA/IrrE family metallo-endopeptidase n=1 Tax=Fodinicola acaciae TaxID=2681555 RepID=UPI0013D485C9|nr:ImmA/IrrE family metallo-endopeptidase [Fodinicola acaciae]